MYRNKENTKWKEKELIMRNRKRKKKSKRQDQINKDKNGVQKLTWGKGN